MADNEIWGKVFALGLSNMMKDINLLDFFRQKCRGGIWEIKRDVLKQRFMTLPIGNGLRIRLRTNDVIGKTIYAKGCFERGVAWALERLICPGMTVFDIGANIGYMTLLMSRGAGPNGTVHAFEPCPLPFLELETNVALNHISNVVLNQLAVGEKAGPSKIIEFGPGMEAYNSLTRVQRADIKPVSSSVVSVIKLDDYIAQKNIRRVHLIKMDIEGAELMALKGAERLINREDCPILVMETTDLNANAFAWSAGDMWRFLQDRDFIIRGIVREERQTVTLKSKEAFVTHCNLEENFVAAKNPNAMQPVL